MAEAASGGRTWWAHFEFTRINIEPIILKNKIEDVREAGASLRITRGIHGRRCFEFLGLRLLGDEAHLSRMRGDEASDTITRDTRMRHHFPDDDTLLALIK